MPLTVPFRRAAVALACALCMAGSANAAPPPQLEAQVARLAALLGDSYSKSVPGSAQVQAVSLPDGRKLAVAVFTIEAYGGGNNHRQYLAVFQEEIDESGPRNHYTLLDVMLVGAKGWQAIHELKVEVELDEQSGTVRFAIPALVNVPGDALNFPSKKTMIHLAFGGRLLEVQPGAAP